MWLTDKHSHVFHQVTPRYSYLRQFAPALLVAVELQSDSEVEPSVIKAVALHRKMNQDGKEIEMFLEPFQKLWDDRFDKLERVMKSYDNKEEKGER